MKTILILAVASASALFVSSCGTGTYTSQNVSGGALLGATAGAVIGHQSGYALEGAALGGVAGALAGHAMTPQGNYQGVNQNVSYQNSGYDDYGYDEPVEYQTSYRYSGSYAPVYRAPVYAPYPEPYSCAPVYPVYGHCHY